MTLNYSNLRNQYCIPSLKFEELPTSPFTLFKTWFDRATLLEKHIEPNAMVVSTSTASGFPSARYVLLKEVDQTGFIFFSNYDSRKGIELSENPNVAIQFYWPLTHRQVRIEGVVEKISNEDSDKYFKSRPIGSQIAGFASPQSQVLESKQVLLKEIEKIQMRVEKNGEDSLKRPEEWGGYRIVPRYFEFWDGQEDRLTDRFEYSVKKEGWDIKMLAP